jgi:diketogulonate reductase-like aldo/keto reductase
MGKSINLAGQTLPALGQGTWYMGEDPSQRRQEVAALQAGIDLGLRLIDTAEMYAEGGAEQVVGEAIRGRREQVFVVSKVYPWNAGGARGMAACDASLKRLGTDYIDLYLLHWSGDIPLEQTLELMTGLQRQGKIGHWGVSNLDIDEMHELWTLAGGEACATDQVLYHLASRGIETDLLPWCQEREIPVMAYCPLAQAGRQRRGLMQHPLLVEEAQALGISVAQLLLAWVIRRPGGIAIPKSATLAHVQDNAAALEISLSDTLLERLDKAFPAPMRKTALDIV